MTSLFYRPTFIALDTSHLSDWMRDRTSPRHEVRQAANDFRVWLEESGCVLLLTYHHIAELCTHENELLVRSRMNFLQGLPFVAWIGDDGPDTGPGGITTILRSEVLTAYNNPHADLCDVARATGTKLLQVGTGEEMLGPDIGAWLTLRSGFCAHAKDAMKIVALARTDVVSAAHIPMSQLLNGKIRSDEERRRVLNLMRGTLAEDIRQHGDKRIQNSRTMADEFIDEVESLAARHPKDPAELVVGTLLENGLNPDEIRPEATLGELLELVSFYRQMQAVTQDIQIPWRNLKRCVQMGRVPSSSISRSLERNAPKLPERKGSELNDFYMACLAPYADFTMVDKRTLEAFRRAKAKEPWIAELCKPVKKASSYTEVPHIVGHR